MKIYAARAITGLNFDEVREYYREIVQYLRALGYDVYYPICGKGYLKGEQNLKGTMQDENFTYPLSADHAIFERDKWMVSQADVVFANLVGTKSVSIGCVSEIVMSHMLGKHTIVSMEKDNIHRHAFVLEAADVIFEDAESAKNYLDVLINGSM